MTKGPYSGLSAARKASGIEVRFQIVLVMSRKCFVVAVEHLSDAAVVGAYNIKCVIGDITIDIEVVVVCHFLLIDTLKQVRLRENC